MRKIYWLLLLSFIIQLSLSLLSLKFPQHPDVLRLREWAKISYLKNFEASYHKENMKNSELPNNYPPATIYTLNAAYRLDLLSTRLLLRVLNKPEGSLIWINSGYLDFIFLRFPSILATLGLGYLVYLISSKYGSPKKSIIAASLFLFNPIALYNGSFWGQIDSLNTLFFIGSLYFLFIRRFSLSIFSLGLSLFYKLTILPVLPFILFFYSKMIKVKTFFLLCVLGFTAAALLTLPISSSPVAWLFNLALRTSGGEINVMTANAHNFWWIIFHPKNLSLIPSAEKLVNGLPLEFWGYGLFFLSLLPLLYLIIKLKNQVSKPKNLILILSLVSILFFLFLPKMHERYLYLFFPLFACYMGMGSRGKILFITLSLLHFYNLLSSWHPFLSQYSLLLENSDLRWTASFLTLVSAIILYIKSFKWIQET